MKSTALLLIAGSALAFGSLANATSCGIGVVKELRVGYKNADRGNAIEVLLDDTYDKQWKSLHVSHNLDDPQGYSLLHLLTASKLSGKRAQLTSSTGRCSELDGVRLL
ncbi:hypothetical protein [Dyella acidiphila]|uniref:Uncharacterized protein n=1 Tax=Dyella acidiphila TaxID=2775866 RepID=A0ABR9G9T7_9GAMM|nr:hypothetical protein [Dyella acidiphila]MBE1160782.1 hypothetical protein [Dyella acidiphila]